MTAAKQGAAFTVITSCRPKTLSKSLERDTDGSIRKSGGGVLVEGGAERRKVEDLAAFAAILTKLRPNQALVYGVARETSVRVMSRTRFAQAYQPKGVVTRVVSLEVV